MRDCHKFKTTPWRVYEDGSASETLLRARVRYGMHYIEGNRLPYFSLTVDRERKTHRAGITRWEEDGGGADHETAARIFPELAGLCKWHLCDQDGTPMHYLANGVFWYRMACGITPRGPHDRDPMECFQSTVVWGAVEGDPAEVPKHWTARKLTEVLEARLHELRAAFHRDMVAAGVEFLPAEAYEAPASGKPGENADA